MKNWTFVLMLLLLMIVSGVAGYFLHRPESIIQTEAIPVIRQDPVLLQRIDSFEIVNKVHVYFIDSLKNEIHKLKKRHETTTHNIDTLPAPVLYRKIAEYFDRKQ